MERIRLSKIKRILISVLILSTLTSCVSEAGSGTLPAPSPEPPSISETEVKGIILPHHLLVEEFIDDFYAEISDENFDRIILISPNHFNYGYSYIQSTYNFPSIDRETLDRIKEAAYLGIEPERFEDEHGVMVHTEFLSRYFPEAKILPITLKGGAPQAQLDKAIEAITKEELKNTLIIASIDFTHYEREEVALANDERTMDWLRSWSSEGSENAFTEIKALAKNSDETTPDAVAMDSPETFYMLIKLMEFESAKSVTFWERTSTTSLTGLKDPLQNTSHIFVQFRKS